MPASSVADVEKDWELLLTKAEDNANDLAHLAGFRSELGTELQGLKGATFRQTTFKAQFHQATREVEGHLERGKALALKLRDSIRGQYGRNAEKLREFGLQPFRRQQRSKRKPQGPVVEGNPADPSKPVTNKK